MVENIIIYGEIGGGILYLAILWGCLICMVRKRSVIKSDCRDTVLFAFTSFFILALGDTPHVCLRIGGRMIGDLEAPISILGYLTNFDALGEFITECSFTLFYLGLGFMWVARFKKRFKSALLFLVSIAVIRSLIMMHPANHWGTIHIIEPWFTLRNIPLFILQAVTGFLIISDALKEKDRMFFNVGLLILFSCACYTAMVLLIHKTQAAGVLMVPKSLACLAMAIILFTGFYRKDELSSQLSQIPMR